MSGFRASYSNNVKVSIQRNRKQLILDNILYSFYFILLRFVLLLVVQPHNAASALLA